jgi:hypothetical protein
MAGPSGHLGQLDEPVQGFGGLAESGSGAGESGGGGGLPRGVMTVVQSGVPGRPSRNTWANSLPHGPFRAYLGRTPRGRVPRALSWSCPLVMSQDVGLGFDILARSSHSEESDEEAAAAVLPPPALDGEHRCRPDHPECRPS